MGGQGVSLLFVESVSTVNNSDAMSLMQPLKVGLLKPKHIFMLQQKLDISLLFPDI